MAFNYNNIVKETEERNAIDFDAVIEKVEAIFKQSNTLEAYCKTKFSDKYIGNDVLCIYVELADINTSEWVVNMFDDLRIAVEVINTFSKDFTKSYNVLYTKSKGMNKDAIISKKVIEQVSTPDISSPDIYTGKLKIKNFGPLPWELTDLEFYRLVDCVENFGVKDLYAILADFKYPSKGVENNIKNMTIINGVAEDLIQAYKSRVQYSEEVANEARSLVEFFVRCNADELSELFPKRYKLQNRTFVGSKEFFKNIAKPTTVNSNSFILTKVRVEPDKVTSEKDTAYVMILSHGKDVDSEDVVSEPLTEDDYNYLFRLTVADENLSNDNIKLLKNFMDAGCAEVAMRARNCYIKKLPDDSSVYQFGMIACNVLGDKLTAEYPNIMRYSEDNPNVWLQIIKNCKESIFNIIEYLKYSI